MAIAFKSIVRTNRANTIRDAIHAARSLLAIALAVVGCPALVLATDSALTLGNVYECPADLPRADPIAAKPSIELFVNEPWLSAIRDGRKKVEGRAGTLETYAAWTGQQARFCSNQQEVIVNVLEVHHYDTLEAFLQAEGWQNAAPHLSSREETAAKYLEFYPGDFISQHGGMNGIIVEVARPPATL